MLGPIKSWYSDFRFATTIHGVFYTLERSKGVALLWYTAVAAGFGLIGLYCSNLIQDWHDRPVSYSYGSLEQPVTEIQACIVL